MNKPKRLFLFCFVFLLVHVHVVAQMFPTSFWCNFERSQDDDEDMDDGDHILSTEISGHPQFYTPGEFYEVTISSSKNFNHIMVMGVTDQPQVSSYGDIMSHNQTCSILFQSWVPRPQRTTQFWWMAPPAGTGCVEFFATVSFKNQLKFKDLLALQLCELQSPPQLAMVHSDGVVLRDDFDSSEHLDASIWSEAYGAEISNYCGAVLHGKSLVFCEPVGKRELTTVFLNASSAIAMQFALSAGTCDPGMDDYSISISYALNNRLDWHLIDKIRVPVWRNTTIHTIHLPDAARRDEVSFRLHQDHAADSYRFQGCWALDNILITNTAHRPGYLEESFDPFTPANWLFFPNGVIKSDHGSGSNALFFEGEDSENALHQFVTSHDLDLSQDIILDDIILHEQFDFEIPASWEIEGAEISNLCGNDQSRNSLVFNGSGKRILCTPYVDTSNIGNVRFYFTMGGGSCDPADSPMFSVSVYAYIPGKSQKIPLQTLSYKSYKKQKLVSLSVPPPARNPETQFCIKQHHHRGLNRNVWSIGDFTLLPWLPSELFSIAQFDLYMNGDEQSSESRTIVEFSTNHGRDWSLLQYKCLPGQCDGALSVDESVYSSKDFMGRWKQATVPLPYATLTPRTRFRWRQTVGNSLSQWGLDNVYIGRDCGSTLCSGHGSCLSTGCRCHPGYSGVDCESFEGLQSSYFSESFESFNHTGSFTSANGSSIGYQCGVLIGGKAIVFDRDGVRQLVTKEFNTTSSWYLQFTIRIGSHSSTSSCPPPDESHEEVFLLYSCNNGITWSELKRINGDDFLQARTVLITLPENAQGPSCRFRWWQSSHSGYGSDVWALDDISLTSAPFYTFSIDFEDTESFTDQLTSSISFHLGEIEETCGHSSALHFAGKSRQNSLRYVETRTMVVGGGKVIQFELNMGCGILYGGANRDEKSVFLEYSTDHGVTWSQLLPSCLPGESGCDGYHQGSIYDNSEFQDWRRVTVFIPDEIRFLHTRFRWVEYAFSARNRWSIDNIYIGEQCPEMCNGHGQCTEGQVCKCDPGYAGPSCTSISLIPLSIQSDFEDETTLTSNWLYILGAHITRGQEDCGVITSGGALYFSGSGARQLITIDINTQSATLVEFYIRMGGHDEYCDGFDDREEGILVQFSTNGGVTWQLLQELYYDDYKTARFVYLNLPESARTSSTRFRWWQPSHSGAGRDQWALDNILIGSGQSSYVHPNEVLNDDPGLWMSTSNAREAYYCDSQAPTLVFTGSAGNRFAVTNKKNVTIGDVIQFKIVIGCKSSFSIFTPVYLQYTQDGGQHWDYVLPPCYPSSDGTTSCPDGMDFQEGTMYHMGQYTLWRLVVVPVSQGATGEHVQFRWWQEGSAHAPMFALSDIHIGSSCPQNCNGHGVCERNRCVCDYGYVEPYCESVRANAVGLQDKFEEGRRTTSQWHQVVGATIGQGCGVVKMGNALVFSARGPREARTSTLNTTSLKMLQFFIKIGSSDGPACQPAVSQNESVLVQYSANSGISWVTIKMIDPTLVGEKSVEVTQELPAGAKGSSIMFRWWQPLISQSAPHAPWALDNILIGANDTHSFGFDDSFDPVASDNWYSIMGAGTNSHCSSVTYALTFDGDDGMPRYAETWDFHMTRAAFIQFDLVMSCGSKMFTDHDVRLEYSLDMGRNWQLVAQECIPPDMGCEEYRYSSVFHAQLYNNWTRVSIPLPEAAISESTRFRWSQPSFKSNEDSWAIDNVHIGAGCLWMCSGHGRCLCDQCICDPGYEGTFCAPSEDSLANQLKDVFDQQPLSSERWKLMLGGSITNACGRLVSGKALVFDQPGIRILETADLDTTFMDYIQFTMQFGCPSDPTAATNSNNPVPLLVQYSYNGGIMWGTIKELYPIASFNKKFYSLEIPSKARMPGTRLKFWQPKHNDEGDFWAIDNIYIGGNSGPITADFDYGLSDLDWTFYNGGEFGQFCDDHRIFPNSSSWLGDSVSMVFQNVPGEHSITTRDIDVDGETVIQFEINVGCTDVGSAQDPVRLEYSQDHGITWDPVREDCFGLNRSKNNGCSGDLHPSSVIYRGEGMKWQRYIIPLWGLHFCGIVRFRWYQGFFRSEQRPSVWALDSVYIGPSCQYHCNGHGVCMKGMFCLCDKGYSGWYCEKNEPHSYFLKESFEGAIDSRKFLQWSGAEMTKKCGELIEGKSLHFTGSGTRMLVTNDLDTTIASEIHFYIKLGCNYETPSHKNHPVLLQYSTNGGISWTLMEEIPFTDRYHEPTQVALEIPLDAQKNVTRFRWWQPSRKGVFIDDWALDQIFIGGHFYGQLILQDDFTSSIQSDGISTFTAHDQNWLITPGSTMEPVCGSSINALYFSNSGQMRYTISSDVQVTEESMLQFELVMGCESLHPQCFKINLDYSLDMGKHWKPVYESCLTTDPDCSSYHSDTSFSADIHHKWQRVVIPLPSWTRSRATRFRWSQHPGFIPSNTWALSRVYIGFQCPLLCSGHGRCDNGLCICDAGWSGNGCNQPTLSLPQAMRDAFTHDPYIGVGGWSGIFGASRTDSCGSVASGDALHFSLGCTRELVTWDLDTTKAEYVQFYFVYGCLNSPVNRNESVLVQFSTNGGIKWDNFKEIHHDQFLTPRFVSLTIPQKARYNGTRFRWWQPLHPGEDLADFAIDNVFIGGTAALPSQLVDNFTTGIIEDHWLFTDNAVINPYCDITHGASSLVGGVDPSEDSAITTRDLRLQDNAVMEFKIAVSCNESWNEFKNPIQLSASLDSGRSWSLLVTHCLPYDPQCQGQVRTSSMYHTNKGWRQVIIKLPSKFTERPVRFRWYQACDPLEVKSSPWSLDDVYIGTSCPENCNGHGSCLYPECYCFDGYSGETCEESSALKTFLKDTFSEDVIDSSKWLLTLGSSLSEDLSVSCGVIHEGQNLYFGGEGQRLAETVDMDLRDARFVQFYVMIGSVENRLSCKLPSKREDMVIVQYSVNSGISWLNFHVLDHKLHTTPTPVYLTLPADARTDSTRLRWWQPWFPGRQGVQWVLDDVYIGGSEINVPRLEESFSDEPELLKWTFYPNGYPSIGVCGSVESVLYWPNTNDAVHENSITTRELIVGVDYVIQFKIVLGCHLMSYSPYTCPKGSPIQLQYSTRPHLQSWKLLHPPCFIDSDDSFCDPHYYRKGSEYDENISNTWTRVTLRIPAHAISSTTQFRWIQNNATSSSSPWGLDDIYIGPPCPGMCRGHGQCTESGHCLCDEGYSGPDCSPNSNLVSLLTETFEGGMLSTSIWSVVRGGRIGQGCGGLVPHALGKSLYFSGCGVREAVTTELDTRRAREISFVLQIGSVDNSNPLCHINLATENIANKAVILQYSSNNGIDWHLIQYHSPREFRRAHRISYELPEEAQRLGVRFRWWQPDNDGPNEDQWALDHIEVVMLRRYIVNGERSRKRRDVNEEIIMLH